MQWHVCITIRVDARLAFLVITTTERARCDKEIYRADPNPFETELDSLEIW